MAERRAQHFDAEAEALLRAGLTRLPDSAPLHHALGLTLVHVGRSAEALGELEAAARLAPNDAHFGYLYAVALHSAGETQRALSALDRARGAPARSRAVRQRRDHQPRRGPARAVAYAERRGNL